MAYYPSLICKMVPLINLWCMYEAKHAVTKMLVSKQKCKNLTKILSSKIREMTVFESTNIDITPEFGSCSCMLLCNYKYAHLIQNKVEKFYRDMEIKLTKWLTHGCKYSKGIMIMICTGKFSSNLQFEQIIDIIILDDRIFFMTVGWITLQFRENFSVHKMLPKASVNLNYCFTKNCLTYINFIRLPSSTQFLNTFTCFKYLCFSTCFCIY